MIPFSRYLFICEGKEVPSSLAGGIVRQLKELDCGVDYDFYAAADPDEALRHVSLYCDLHKGLDTCFVSCGGDALTSGVAGGLVGAGEGMTLAVYGPQQANTLARCCDEADFSSIAALISGTATPVDMIRVNNSYVINAVTFGLDDITVGKGFLNSLSTALRRSFHSLRIKADGVPLDTGSILFFILSNGRYAPGGVLCAPGARNDDGRMDLCAVRNMPPGRMMKLLPALASGGFADEPAFAADLILRRARTIDIESSKDITLMLDTRPLTGSTFSMKIIPGAVTMVIPASAADSRD